MQKTTARLIIVLLLGSWPVFAQSANPQTANPQTVNPQILGPQIGSPQTASPQTVSRDERLKSLTSFPKTDPEYRLGSGDLIEVGVFGVDEFRHTLRINASGIIKLPLLEPVSVAGLTPAELEQHLTALLETDVIKNPQVSVFVKEYRSQPIYLLGAVRTPGQYQISLQIRVVDAISMAGGLLPNAGDLAVIQRKSSDGGEQTLNIDLRELLENGDLTRNVVVQGGDVIHVKERVTETVYVIGEVTRSGAFVKAPNQDLRVSQAIAWAGGPGKTAKLSKGLLVRYKEGGAREQLPVDFGEILRGKKEDFLVRANDIIFVPGSKFKELTTSMVNGLAISLPYMIIP